MGPGYCTTAPARCVALGLLHYSYCSPSPGTATALDTTDTTRTVVRVIIEALYTRVLLCTRYLVSIINAHGFRRSIVSFRFRNIMAVVSETPTNLSLLPIGISKTNNSQLTHFPAKPSVFSLSAKLARRLPCNRHPFQGPALSLPAAIYSRGRAAKAREQAIFFVTAGLLLLRLCLSILTHPHRLFDSNCNFEHVINAFPQVLEGQRAQGHAEDVATVAPTRGQHRVRRAGGKGRGGLRYREPWPPSGAQ